MEPTEILAVPQTGAASGVRSGLQSAIIIQTTQCSQLV